MELTDLTEMTLEQVQEEQSGPLKINDVSNVTAFEQRAIAAQTVVEETSQVTENVTQPAGLPKGYLSYSQIDLFLRCKFAYWCRYWAKKLGSDDKVAAQFGKLIHKVLEQTYLWIQANKYRGKFPIEIAYEFLKRFWADPEDGMPGSKPEYWMDARAMLRQYAQENGLVDFNDILAVELGSIYDEDGKPIPNASIGGVPFVAKLDLVLRDDETTIRIRDYKTDRMMRWKEDVDRDLQLGLYDLVVRAEYPWAQNVVLELYMLRHGVSQYSESRSADQRADVEAFVAEIAREIGDEKEWPATLNEFCHWCDHKGTCSKYAEALEGGTSENAILARDLVQIGTDPKKFAEMFNLRDQYNNRRGILDRRKNSFDKALKKFMDSIPGSASGRDPITVGDREFYVFTQRRTEYKDRVQVVELLSKRLGVPEGFVDAVVCKIQKTVIDGALKDLLAGKTVGQVFDFSGEGSEKKPATAFVEMVKIELESIAEVTHSTRLVSRASKVSKTKKKKQEEATRAIPMITDAMVEQARKASTIGYTLKGEAQKKIEAPEPTTPIATHTRTPVNSSHLRSVSYDVNSKTLQIEFADRGVYNFFGVVPEVHANLMAAPSKGTFFKANIRKVFRYEKTDQIGFDQPAEPRTETVADPMWQAAEVQALKPVAAVGFEGASDDYLDPDVALALWKKAAPRGNAAAKRPGQIRFHAEAKPETAPPLVQTAPPEAPPPPALSMPVTAPPQLPVPPAKPGKKPKRAPMSDETKAKISASRKAAWEKKKSGD